MMKKIFKKIFTITICAVLLMTASLTLASCSSGTENPISFGKKYMSGEDMYYVFYSDHTGIYHCEYEYNSDAGSNYDYTISGEVEFVWEEASDGAVYLFEVETRYNENHTEGKNISLTGMPIYFSEDFLTYTTHSQYGASTNRYIKEGSKLEKSLKD